MAPRYLAFFSALGFVLGLPSLVQAQAKVGDVAPPIQTKVWIGQTWPGFAKGRATVVEFWAPWCGPCVQAIPHLNALVDETKDLPVDFVSVTDEPETKIREFIRTRPLRTRVALDDGGKTFAAYGAKVIPHTVIVGPDGRIVAVTRPGSVTKDAIRAALAGEAPNLPKTENVEPDANWDVKAGLDPDAALSLSVFLPSTATEPAFVSDRKRGRIVADGYSLLGALRLAYGAQLAKVRGDLPKVDTRLRFVVKAPDGSYDTALSMLQEAIEKNFGFTARWEEVEREVPVLRRTGGPVGLKAASDATPGGMARMGLVSGIRQPVSYLAQMAGLFSPFGEKAVDETGLTGLYDIEFEWTPSDRKAFEESLRKLGFELVKARRKVRELVVSGKG